METLAAAVTEVAIKNMFTPKTIDININRPFIFMLIYPLNNTILFVGKFFGQ